MMDIKTLFEEMLQTAKAEKARLDKADKAQRAQDSKQHDAQEIERFHPALLAIKELQREVAPYPEIQICIHATYATILLGYVEITIHCCRSDAASEFEAIPSCLGTTQYFGTAEQMIKYLVQETTHFIANRPDKC